MEALKNDFVGHERILALVSLTAPQKCGNDDDFADEIMQQVFRLFRDYVTSRPTVRGGTYRIQMLPTTCHIYFGEVMGASPSRRRAHIAHLRKDFPPEKGADRGSPTAVIKSCAKMDHLSTRGTLLNQKFTRRWSAGRAVAAEQPHPHLLQHGRSPHQFNIVDQTTCATAQQNPEEYRDLIVRVAGSRLLPQPQQDLAGWKSFSAPNRL